MMMTSRRALFSSKMPQVNSKKKPSLRNLKKHLSLWMTMTMMI